MIEGFRVPKGAGTFLLIGYTPANLFLSSKSLAGGPGVCLCASVSVFGTPCEEKFVSLCRKVSLEWVSALLTCFHPLELFKYLKKTQKGHFQLQS